MEVVAPLRTVSGRDVVKMNPASKLRKIATKLFEAAMYPPTLKNGVPRFPDMMLIMYSSSTLSAPSLP